MNDRRGPEHTTESPTGRKRAPLRTLLWERTPRPGYAALAIVVFWLATAALFGWIEHLIDSQTFPNTWLGMWWALQTVTTVGYGDIVPQQAAGRVVAAILMLGGLALLSVLTAAVTSIFVSRAQERLQETGTDPVLLKLDAVMTSQRHEVSELKAEIRELRLELARRET